MIGSRLRLFERRTDRWALRLLKFGMAQAFIGTTVVIIMSAYSNDSRRSGASAEALEQPVSAVEMYQLAELQKLDIGRRLQKLEDAYERQADDNHDAKLLNYGIISILVTNLGATSVLVKGQRSRKDLRS